MGRPVCEARVAGTLSLSFWAKVGLIPGYFQKWGVRQKGRRKKGDSGRCSVSSTCSTHVSWI